MATIPQIAMGFRQPEIASPLNMMAQVSQIQAAQDANALRQLQMQQVLRQQEQENALAAMPYGTLAATPQEALRYGAPGRQLYESLLKGSKEKREAELAEARIAGENIKTAKASLGGVSDQSTFDAWRANTVRLLPGLAGALPTTYSPEAVRKLALDADKLYENVTSTLNLGRVQTVVQTPKYGGDLARPVGSFAEMPTELDVARTEQARAAASASRAQAEDGKRSEISRLQAEAAALPVGSQARIQIENRIDALGRGAAPTLTEVIDPDQPSRMLRVDARSYVGGGLGSPGVIGVSGKEPSAARRASVEEEGREQFRSIIDDLRANFDKLNRMRAITSTARGPISNVATALETTGVGQVASRAVGGEAQAIRDEIASQRSQLFSALKKITGKSASELNSVVELRTFLDAISDPTKSYESAINILDNLENTYTRGGETSAGPRSAVPRGAAPSGAAGPARVTSDADYNKLPSGTVFIGPDGVTRRKP